MEKWQRIAQSQEMKENHLENHLANKRIYHGWLGKQWFEHGIVRQPVRQWLERRQMRRVSNSGKR